MPYFRFPSKLCWNGIAEYPRPGQKKGTSQKYLYCVFFSFCFRRCCHGLTISGTSITMMGAIKGMEFKFLKRCFLDKRESGFHQTYLSSVDQLEQVQLNLGWGEILSWTSLCCQVWIPNNLSAERLLCHHHDQPVPPPCLDICWVKRVPLCSKDLLFPSTQDFPKPTWFQLRPSGNQSSSSLETGSFICLFNLFATWRLNSLSFAMQPLFEGVFCATIPVFFRIGLGAVISGPFIFAFEFLLPFKLHLGCIFFCKLEGDSGLLPRPVELEAMWEVTKD